MIEEWELEASYHVYFLKIGDFGMARDLAKDDCYEARGTTIPLKWTAPEVPNNK